jgi:nucleoside-diphosphate-sugar epimerase
MRVLVIGGTRFVGYQLVWRLLAGGHTVTLLNRGSLSDPFGARVERLRGDRTTADFARLLKGRSYDAAIDFAAYLAADAEGVVQVLGDAVGHYVVISTGQVYLVRKDCPRPAREQDYEGPLMEPPADPGDRKEWDYGMGKRAAEDVHDAPDRARGETVPPSRSRTNGTHSAAARRAVPARHAPNVQRMSTLARRGARRACATHRVVRRLP